MFVGFGHGPRTCIGNKFTMVETTCFLVMLLRGWKVGIGLLDDETPEEWHCRVLSGKVKVTLRLGAVSLKLTKRA
jgi:cytochrome P450